MNLTETRAKALLGLGLNKKNLANRTNAQLARALNQCTGTSLPLPPMTKTILDGYEIYTAVGSPLSARQFVNLFAGKALGPIAQKVGLVSKGVSKRVLKGLILKKLVDLKVPEPIRRKVATKRTRDQSVATNQSLAVANTNQTPTNANAKTNQPSANGNTNQPAANTNRVRLNEPELNFRPNGTAEFLNRETVGNKTFVVPEGASKMTFPKMARVNSAQNFEAQNLGKHRALSFSGATGRMGSVNRNGINFRIPNIKFPAFGSPKKNLKIPTNSENKNFEKMLKQFNVPEPPQLMEARRELEQTRAAAGPQNPMTQELEVKVREMEKKQSPQATGAGAGAGNGNRTTPQVPRVNGNRPVSQVSGNGNALQKVKNEANAERRRIEANAARARANLEANARRVQNNLKEQLSGAKNANKEREIQARLEKNKINLETKKAELAARTERNKAALAARVAERQANVNLRKAELAARAASASGRSGPSLWNKVRNMVKKKPGGGAPAQFTREDAVRVLMEAGASRAQINEVRTSGNFRQVVERLAQGGAYRFNNPEQGEEAQGGDVPQQNVKQRKIRNVGEIRVPMGLKDAITHNVFEKNQPVYRVKHGKLYSYYGVESLNTWLKKENRPVQPGENITNMEKGRAVLVNLKNFGNVANKQLQERLMSLVPYIYKNGNQFVIQKSSGGQRLPITNMELFKKSMGTNKHYEELVTFLKSTNSVTNQRVKKLFENLGLRRGAPAPTPGNGGAPVNLSTINRNWNNDPDKLGKRAFKNKYKNVKTKTVFVDGLRGTSVELIKIKGEWEFYTGHGEKNVVMYLSAYKTDEPKVSIHEPTSKDYKVLFSTEVVNLIKNYGNRVPFLLNKLIALTKNNQQHNIDENFIKRLLNGGAPIQKVEESTRFSAIKQKLKNSGVSNANIQKLIRGPVSENEDTMLSTFNTKANEFIRKQAAEFQNKLNQFSDPKNIIKFQKAYESSENKQKVINEMVAALKANEKPMNDLPSPLNFNNLNKQIIALAKREPSFNKFKQAVNTRKNYQSFLETFPGSTFTNEQKRLLKLRTEQGYSNFRKTLDLINVPFQKSRIQAQVLQNKKQSAEERLKKRLNTIKAIKAGNRNNNLERLKANNNNSIKQAAENRNAHIGSVVAKTTSDIISRITSANSETPSSTNLLRTGPNSNEKKRILEVIQTASLKTLYSLLNNVKEHGLENEWKKRILTLLPKTFNQEFLKNLNGNNRNINSAKEARLKKLKENNNAKHAEELKRANEARRYKERQAANLAQRAKEANEAKRSNEARKAEENSARRAAEKARKEEEARQAEEELPNELNERAPNARTGAATRAREFLVRKKAINNMSINNLLKAKRTPIVNKRIRKLIHGKGTLSLNHAKALVEKLGTNASENNKKYLQNRLQNSRFQGIIQKSNLADPIKARLQSPKTVVTDILKNKNRNNEAYLKKVRGQLNSILNRQPNPDSVNLSRVSAFRNHVDKLIEGHEPKVVVPTLKNIVGTKSNLRGKIGNNNTINISRLSPNEISELMRLLKNKPAYKQLRESLIQLYNARGKLIHSARKVYEQQVQQYNKNFKSPVIQKVKRMDPINESAIRNRLSRVQAYYNAVDEYVKNLKVAKYIVDYVKGMYNENREYNQDFFIKQFRQPEIKQESRTNSGLRHAPGQGAGSTRNPVNK